MDLTWQWVFWLLFHWITRYVAAWLVALLAMWLSISYAWDAFGDHRRGDGNGGHSAIDFGGQWLMGAMLVQGHGRELYNRNYQRQVLNAAFPYEDEVPDNLRDANSKGGRDPDQLMSWLMGTDNPHAADTVGSCVTPLAATNGLDAACLAVAAEERWTKENIKGASKKFWVGGPLYPPINAFYFAPFGLLRPQVGYRVNQILTLVWALGAGLGISYLTRGRFWWPIAVVIICAYPGFKGSIHLGQNAALTLILLVWGWALLSRGHQVAGGIVWGLLAFKPVWALAFILVPLVTGRLRFCAAMTATGIALALITLPFVGLHSWFDWLQVGSDAAALYNVDVNWVHLSRDLLGIPRRFMLDFSLPNAQRDRLDAGIWSWALWAGTLEITALLLVLRRTEARAMTGPAPAFLMLCAWMHCYHFMYYDVLLSVLPFFLLFGEPRRYLEPIIVGWLRLSKEQLGDAASYFGPRLPEEYPAPVPLLRAGMRNLLVVNRMVPNLLVLMFAVEHVFPHLGIGMTMTGAYWDGPVKLSTYLYVDGQPWDTYVLIFLWLWCGWLWLRQGSRAPQFTPVKEEPVADVILVPLPEAGHAIRPA